MLCSPEDLELSILVFISLASRIEICGK